MKKIVKGLKALNLFSITKNTATEYTTGTAISVPGIQQLSSEPNTTDWSIPADDEVYEAGTDWNGEAINIQLAELPLELKSHFEGGEYNETTKTYRFKNNSQAPEIGLSFAAQTSDGQYLMKKIFALRCTKVTLEHRTKGNGDSYSPYTITGLVKNRTKDGAVRDEQYSVDGDLTWMNTLAETEPEG